MINIYNKPNILKVVIILSLILLFQVQLVRANEENILASSSPTIELDYKNLEFDLELINSSNSLHDTSKAAPDNNSSNTEHVESSEITFTDSVLTDVKNITDNKNEENYKVIKPVKQAKQFERLVIEPVAPPTPQNISNYPKFPDIPLPPQYKKKFKILPPPPRPPRRVVRLDTIENIDSTSTLPVYVLEDLQTSTSTEDTVDVEDFIIEDISPTSTAVEATSTDSSVGTSLDDVPVGDPVEIPDLPEVAPVILPKTDDTTSSDVILP